ncbi:MAG: (d)CMP kinase [Flavobacteriales bacterium]|nr:(d)CMP kinase [Flavobacteriales bacterium]
MTKPIIIAIDGYSSCGKSTIAKALAKRLNYAYVDTGAMYRAVSLYILRAQLDWKNLSEEELDQTLDQIHISFHFNEESQSSDTYLNGENIEEEIRGKQVSESVSEISQLKTIRKRMVSLQQEAGLNKKMVMDGRDIGTKVFPNAELKLFMTADPKIRAKRRYDELKANGKELNLEEIENNLEKRDYNDTHREENPLRKATDAIKLDNSYMNQEEQLSWVLQLVEDKLV